MHRHVLLLSVCTACAANTVPRADVPLALDAFLGRHPELVGKIRIPDVDRKIETTPESVRQVAAKYLTAVQEAGRIYRHIEAAKDAGSFVTEVSMDETDAPQTLRLWAMAETPRFLLNAAGIAELGRNPNSCLDCFVTGTNDLVKETGISAGQGRQYLQPLLTQIVIAARAGGLDAIDGVYNDFRDEEGFTTECAQGAALGFDGKSLIHPAQIETANVAFSPSPDEIAKARAIADAFARPENAGKGVISLDGRMVERLHLAMAEKLLARAGQ